MNSLPAQAAPDRSLHAYLWWATTVAWAATIFYFSTGAYGGWLTAWLLRQVLDLLGVHLPAVTFNLLHNFIRKLAHLTEYAIYASLLYGSLGGGRDFTWRMRRALLCVAAAAIYSLTDEFHQMFVPGRGPAILDCVIDTSGASVGMVMMWARDRVLQAKARRRVAANDSPADT